MTLLPHLRSRLAALLVALAVLSACSGSTAAPVDPGAPRPAEVQGDQAATAAVRRSPAGSDLDLLAQLLAGRRTATPSVAVATPVATEPAPPSGPPYTTGPRPGSPVVIPPPALPPGDATVYAVGDSVLLGTEPYLRSTLGSGWDLRFDARVSRRFPEGIDIVHENRASVGQVAIVLLGHNYGGGRKVLGYLDQLMADLGRAQRVVFVTVAEWSDAQPEVNAAIRMLPFRHPNVVVADWQAVVAANPQFLVGDRVHLSRSGNVALANLLAVLIGPAPARDGRVPPPPRILPIPDEADPVPGTPIPPLTWPPGTGTTTTTTGPGASTTTTVPASTTTSSSSTTSSSTTTSGPPPPSTTTTEP